MSFNQILKNKKAWSIIRLLISSLVLFFVLRSLNITRLYSTFSSVQLYYLVLALMVTIIQRFLITWRWSLLVRTYDSRISIFRLLKIILVTHAVGVLIPSSLSRDGLRAYVLTKQTGNTKDSFSSVLVDRFAGLFTLVGISSFVGLFSWGKFHTSEVVPISCVLFVVLCILVVLAIYYEEKFDKLAYRFESSHKHKFIFLVIDTLKTILQFRHHKLVLGKVFGLTLICHLCRIFLIFCFAATLNIEISFVYFALFLPIIMVILMLPISISGIGVQEGAFIYFFSPFGMSVEQAVGISLFCYLDDLLWVFMGLAIYARKGLEMNSYMNKKGAIS